MKEKFEKKLKLMKEALFVRGTNRIKCYPRIFFTADTHFGSERTLQLSRRPYKNTQQMDEALIRNWNATIKDTDHVYHLGDFGHYSNIKHLNGKVHLLMGNYERKDFQKILSQCNNCQEKAKNTYINYLMEPGFTEVIDAYNAFLECPHNGKLITYCLIHEPERAMQQLSSKTIFNLFGHIHNLQMVKRYGLCVSTDAHHFRPINIKEVEYYMDAINNHYDKNVFD